MGKLLNIVLIFLIVILLALSVFFIVGWMQKKQKASEAVSLAPVSVAGGQITFENSGTGMAEISILTQPASAQVLVDGVVKGFTPLKLPSVTVGKHQVSLIYSGYKTRTFNLLITEGLRVVVNVALEKQAPEATQIPATETPL